MDFRTPSKTSQPDRSDPPKTNSTSRQGDWVCLQCNNLNFSFRKKCNRCKLQTRYDNQQLSAYYSQLVPSYHQPDQKENFPSLNLMTWQSPSSLQHPSPFSTTSQ